MNCDAIFAICVAFVVVIALCIILFCLGSRTSGAMSLAKTTLDSISEDDSDEDDFEEDDYGDEDEDDDEGAEVRYTVTSIPRDLTMGGGDKSSDADASTDGCKVLDFDDFLNPALLDDEDDEDDDNDLFAETLVRIATIEDYDGFVNDMLEKTSKIMKHITSIQVALKREEDADNANLFIVLRHHLQQQMQDYHDIVETVNKYVGRNEDYIDAVVAIEEEIAKVEGYNL